MGNPLRFNNLKAILTGTSVGSRYAADVFVRNDSANPIPVQGVSGVQTLETRIHDCSAAGINNNAGAFVQIGAPTPADIANTISKVQISSNVGEPLCFRIGADATAAASAENKFIVNQGEGPTTVDVSLASGDKLWVRSLTSTAISSGYITLNLIG